MGHFCSLQEEELTEWMRSMGQPAFRTKQLFDWVYKKFELSFSSMTNLSGSLKEALQKEFVFPALTQVSAELSTDNETEKYLWKLADGSLIESVLIMNGDKRTLCVSSQVGCNARCAFCASGKKGLKRDLETGEIVEQVLQVCKRLAERGELLTNIVFMGMGEPLDNYENVVAALKIITSPDLLGISRRRITVSTVGVVEGIDRLTEEALGVNLVLSLHAPNQNIRKKIIPYARKYPFEDVVASLRKYAHRTKRDITYEYILIDGINAEVEHAVELSKVIHKEHSSINLIPYNPVPGLKLKRPSAQKIAAFKSALFQAGVRSTQRYTKGKDIAAACGQLALKELESAGSSIQSEK